MKSSQFLGEGDDKTVDDVKQNHPEIYEFYRKIGAWMAFDHYGQVEAYNTAGNHMVVIKIKPSAGLSNTKANLDDAGIPYDSHTDTWAGELVTGTFGEDIHFSIKDDGRRGNITETWQFALPHADDEVATYHDRTMEEVDEGKPATSTLKQLIKKAGYRKPRDEHFPRRDRDEAPVHRLEDLIKQGGYERSKSGYGGEYVYEYDVDGTVIVFNYRDVETGLSGWFIVGADLEGLEEADVATGDFGAKGGPKPQTQNMKPISLAQAFGSEAYNVLADAGIKFHEKPSYWSDLERNALGEIGQKRVEKILADAGIELEEFPAWQIYPVDDMNPDDYVKGPLQTVENMPEQKVFIIYDLPYSDLRHGVQDPRVGTFLVDRQGASSYIRFWRQIS